MKPVKLIYVFSTLFFVLAMLTSWSLAQDSNQTSTSPQSSTEHQDPASAVSGMNTADNSISETPDLSAPAPMPLGAQAESLDFTPEVARKNYIRGGVSLQSTYDDNALLTNTNQVSNFAYSVFPNIALEQSRARLNWMLNYAAGLTVNQRLASRNQASHNLNFDLGYRLAPHISVRLRDKFLDTTGFFEQLNGNQNFADVGVLQRPNQFLITPLATQISNLGSGEIDYQFSSSSAIGASGSFYNSSFTNAPPGSALVDTQSREAEGSYSYRVNNANTVGVTYKFQRLTFDPGVNETNVHSVLGSYTFRLQQHMTLSVFGGPEYSTIQNSTASGLSGSGGVTYSYQGLHTSVLAEFVRKISNGGGWLGAVLLNNADATIRRQLSPGWTVSLGGIYSRNHSLINGTSGISIVTNSIQVASANVAADRRLGENVMLQFGYGRDFQKDYGLFGKQIIANPNRNRAWVSVSYNFARPWGR